ncbi:hypothetical protein [Pedobacter sp. GR22-10]|uniref:hypothetical protein n=1 Tax=Pedobacter TaxID=84567 RepID=UPI0022459752|nr:hypothetical protein [Pedobacter sp. GR22-10]MCX2429630.1 hypothetical protein [Pedobacter sp. GR22-10]
MKLNYKLTLLLTGAIMISLSSCVRKSNQERQSTNQPEAKIEGKTEAGYGLTNTWIDDLKNLRTAVSKGDLEKMKTYFNFPLVDDTTQIWSAVYDGVEEDKKPKEYKEIFTEDDFKDHCTSLFNAPFIKSIGRVDLDKLYKTNESVTDDIKGKLESYHMVANFDKPTAMLQLSVVFSGELDEKGNAISETEHAIIYFFKINDDKYLKFDKILFAG